MALGLRLIDLGCFRLGSEESADHGSHGLTTLERRHVRPDNGAVVFHFDGKSGVKQQIRVDAAEVTRAVRSLVRGRHSSSRLLSVRTRGRWEPLSPTAINEHLRDLAGLDVTAKDFRTWHGTVQAAVVLGREDPARSTSGRKRQVRGAIGEVADLLGNTPAVSRASYVDPRVVDRFDDGRTIAGTLARLPRDPAAAQNRLDRAVVRLLSHPTRH